MDLKPSKAKSDDIQRRTSSKKRILFTATLAIGLLIVPIALVFVDPVIHLVDYKLRLDNGSLLQGLLQTRFEGPKIYLNLFNVSNAEEFMAGRDTKVKLEEIGPFVFQEYRTNEDLEINQEPGVMRYTPKLKTLLVTNESIGRPEDIYVTMPNMPLLAASALMSKYPYILRQIFNAVAASVHSKAFITVTAHDYLYGYHDPLLHLANTVVPGLIYFNSVGLMERLYDVDADYRLELGTKISDKFSVKKVTRIPLKKSNAVLENTQSYNDTFEGAAFPPHLTPEMPIHIYRHSICKSFQLQHVGFRDMYYGGEAFVYHSHNTTFNDHQQCDTTGWCPGGLKNMAPCYFGFPLVLSKGHFLDADPRLLNQTEGLAPDRKLHDFEITIDPKIGVAITGSISLQLSLFLADIGYNSETRKLKDTVLPVSFITVKPPRMLEEVRSALQLIYARGPCIVLTSQILCTLLGLGLLTYSARIIYWNRMERTTKSTNDSSSTRTHDLRLRRGNSKTQWPLLLS